MIRINLLPEAKRVAVASGSSQAWGIGYMLAVAAWGVALTLYYMSYKSQLDEQLAANAALEQSIESVKAKSANLGEVEAQLANSRQLEEVVSKLQSARQGPARVLMEMSSILSDGRGPTISAERLEALRRNNPLAGFNAGWDIRRLWLTSFTENARKCNIQGMGRTNEDVAEFLRRLALSELFEGVTLQSTSSAADSGQSTVAFTLSCHVRY
jgi:type IV pilus assembly protein PilN